MILFTILGIVFTIFLIYKLLLALWIIFYPHVLAKLLGHVIDLKTLGKWAVVTGATDGIGKGYAKELAKRGVNVYLISRSEQKLKDTADEIRKISPKVEIKTLAIDFAQATAEVYRTKIANALKNIDVGILVNNVGMGYEGPNELASVKDAENFLQNIVLVNCVSALQLTRLVLPSMLAKRKGAIITISSACSFTAFPLLTVYSATKIFLDYLNSGLGFEYPDSGIFFQVVNPFYVVTKMSGMIPPSFTCPDPDSYAANALNTVGLTNATSGCFSHELQRIGMKLTIGILPSSIVGSKLETSFKSMQKRYLRAQEKGETFSYGLKSE